MNRIPQNQIYIPAAYDIGSEVTSEAPKTLSYFSALSQTKQSVAKDSVSNLMIDVDDSVSAKYMSLKPERQRSR